jgi:hypothetical protein
MLQDEPSWPRAFLIAMYASIGSRARMLRAYLDPDARAVASGEEAAHLRAATEHLESAAREVAAILPDDARSALPRDAYGTYLGDEIGAVLMRIQDYGEGFVGIAAGLHAYESELTQADMDSARQVERLLAEATRIFEQ